MVILGGMGNVWGVLLGAAFLEYLNQEGLANIGAWLNLNLGTHIDVPGYQVGIYGVLIVLVMLLRPQGLLPSARRKRELQYGTHDEYLYDVETHDTPVYVGGAGDADGATCSKRSGCARSSAASSPSPTSTSSIPRGVDRQPDRPERRRQDDVLQHDHRRLQADRGARSSSTARTSPAKPPHAVTERGIGRTFQNIRLFQDMTALENVLVGMHCRLKGGIIGSDPRARRA